VLKSEARIVPFATKEKREGAGRIFRKNNKITEAGTEADLCLNGGQVIKRGGQAPLGGMGVKPLTSHARRLNPAVPGWRAFNRMLSISGHRHGPLEWFTPHRTIANASNALMR
jgi:hypothetical protein